MDLALARAARGAARARAASSTRTRFHGLVSQCRAAKERRSWRRRARRACASRVAGPRRRRRRRHARADLDARRGRGRRCSTASSRASPPTRARDARRARACASGACRSRPTPRSRATSPTSSRASARRRARRSARSCGPTRSSSTAARSSRRRCASASRDVIGAWHAPDGGWRPAVLDGDVAPARGRARRRVLRARAPRRSACASAAARRAPTTSGLRRRRARSASCRAAWRRARRSTLEGARARAAREPPGRFPLFTATDRSGEQAGELVDARGRRAHARCRRSAPCCASAGSSRSARCPCSSRSRLTEIGTLELWCRSRTTEHRWRLEFRLRDTVGAEAPPPEAAAALVVEPARVERGDARCCAAPSRAPTIRSRSARRLEAALDAGRDAWPLPRDPRALGRALDARASARAHARARGAVAEPRRLSPPAGLRRSRRRPARRSGSGACSAPTCATRARRSAAPSGGTCGSASPAA